jgi:hypothetical protein
VIHYPSTIFFIARAGRDEPCPYSIIACALNFELLEHFAKHAAAVEVFFGDGSRGASVSGGFGLDAA